MIDFVNEVLLGDGFEVLFCEFCLQENRKDATDLQTGD